MNIGQAAAAAGVSAKAIRYYESIGLIPAAARTGAGYRAYAPSDVAILHIIRRARDLGFSIDRVRCLVGLWQDRDRAAAEVKRIALAHVGEIEARIAELQALSAKLQALADACPGDQHPECPILHDLEGRQPAESRAA